MGDALDCVVGVSDHGPFGADAEIDPTAGSGLARVAGRSGDDRGHRDKHPGTLFAEGHRQYPGPTLGEQSLKPPRVFLAADGADDRQCEVTVVGFQPHRAVVESDPATVVTAGLEPGKPDPATGSLAPFRR